MSTSKRQCRGVGYYAPTPPGVVGTFLERRVALREALFLIGYAARGC